MDIDRDIQKDIDKDPSPSLYVLSLLEEMQKADDKNELWMFIRNMQVATASLLKDFSLSDSESWVAFDLKKKLKNGEEPTQEEKLIFALEAEKVFKSKELL